MSLPYDIHDCVQCNICFECYSTGERARNCEKICKERLKELNRMNEIKNPLLKELETNAKEFLEYLDNNSERIREIEETLKKLKLFITFWHSIKIIGNYHTRLSWESDEKNNNSYRIFLTEITFDSNENVEIAYKKPLLESSMRKRIDASKYLNEFIVAMTSFIKDYKNKELNGN